MIVEKMTFEEINNEIIKDLEECYDKLDQLEAKYRRSVVKSKRFPVYFEPILFTTKRHNRYLLYYSCNSRKIQRDSVIKIINIFYRKEGLFAIHVTPERYNISTIVLTPHLFQRYRERVLQEDIQSLESIRRFFMNNNFFIGFSKNNEYQVRCDEGYLLGVELKHNITLCKTMISKNMMKGNQIELSEFVDEYLNVS